MLITSRIVSCVFCRYSTFEATILQDVCSAAVKDIPEKEIRRAIDANADSNVVELDFSGLDKGVETLSIPASTVANAGSLSFKDSDSVSSRAGEGVKWCVAAGILNGSDNKLDPQGSATRAQAAAMLQRFCENVLK